MSDHETNRSHRRGGISVVGSGAVTVEPDMASLSIGINSQSTNLDTTRDLVATKATAARDYLVGAGVDPVDLQTTRLSVRPIRHDHQPGPRNRRPVEYAVTTTLMAVFRESLDQAQAAVDGLFDVVDDALQLHGLSFDCSERAAAEVEARALAFADANAKAEQLASLAGLTLGAVRNIQEEQGDFGI